MTLFLVCVLNSTVPLDRKMYLRLFAAAQAMRQSGGARKYDLDGEGKFSGRLTTTWVSHSLGTFCGPKFDATLEIGSRSGRAEFIVPERWLEHDCDPDELLVV